MIKEKVKISTSWYDVAIRDFIELNSYMQSIKVNELTQDSLIEYKLKVLSILSNLDYDYWLNVPYQYIVECFEKVSFIKNKPKSNIKKYYSIDGVKYFPELEISNLKAGQYIDICTILRDSPNDIHKLLAVIMKKNNIYNPDNYSEISNVLYNKFNIADAYALSRFFLLILKTLTKSILTSSQSQLMKQMKKNPELMKVIQKDLEKAKTLLQSGIISI